MTSVCMFLSPSFFFAVAVRMDFTEAYSDRCSAVGLAARDGDATYLKKLIKQGYSVDVRDNRGWMAIHEAAFHNRSECLKLLLHAGKENEFLHGRNLISWGKANFCIFRVCLVLHAWDS